MSDLRADDLQLPAPHVVTAGGLRVLCIAEVRGELHVINTLATKYRADLVVHTGNFGFFDVGLVLRIHDSYLRHIAAFLRLVLPHTFNLVGQLLRVNGDVVEHGEGPNTQLLKELLANERLLELDQFLSGALAFVVPVYAIYGMAEDVCVVNRFRSGMYRVPNLHLVDELLVFSIPTGPNAPCLTLFGLGGGLSMHNLFHSGTTGDHDAGACPHLPAAGDPGNMWVTMLQMGQLVNTLRARPAPAHGEIRLMLLHMLPVREPLLGHLAVYLQADYTMLNGLHFKYPLLHNELLLSPLFDQYKLKFSEARAQLATVWLEVADTVRDMCLHNLHVASLVGTALDAFDCIPSLLLQADEHTPLSLALLGYRLPTPAAVKLQNDLYYGAFQTMWHFNVCDWSSGSLVLNIANARVKLEMEARGFDFSFRANADGSDDEWLGSSEEGQRRGSAKPRRSRR